MLDYLRVGEMSDGPLTIKIENLPDLERKLGKIKADHALLERNEQWPQMDCRYVFKMATTKMAEVTQQIYSFRPRSVRLSQARLSAGSASSAAMK